MKEDKKGGSGRTCRMNAQRLTEDTARSSDRAQESGSGEVHTAFTGHRHRQSATASPRGNFSNRSTEGRGNAGREANPWVSLSQTHHLGHPLGTSKCYGAVEQFRSQQRRCTFSGGQESYINTTHSSFLWVTLGPGTAQGSLRRLAGFYTSRLA